MTIKPLFDKIVIKSVEAETKTAGGILVAPKSQEKPQLAKVLAVGPGGLIDGKEVTMQIKVGDLVLYSKYSGSEFKLDGEEVIIVRQSDILAIVDKE